MNVEKFFLALNPAKIKMGLQRTHKLLELCGNPEKKLTIIQVAGTNGKGSVCAILESIFRHSGHKTGLFTSPHLYKINERIRINGIAVSNEKLIDFISRILFCLDFLKLNFLAYYDSLKIKDSLFRIL